MRVARTTHTRNNFRAAADGWPESDSLAHVLAGACVIYESCRTVHVSYNLMYAWRCEREILKFANANTIEKCRMRIAGAGARR